MTKIEELTKEVQEIKKSLAVLCDHFGVGKTPPATVLQLKKQAAEIIGASGNGSTENR